MSSESAPRERSFLSNVNIVMLTYAADGLLAFATGVLIARSLGPNGRGAYSLFIVSAAFGQLLLGLGIGNAAIYYLNKRQMSLRDILGAIHVVVVAAAGITAAIVAILVQVDTNFITIGDYELGFTGESVFGAGISPWLLVVAVPVLLYMGLLNLVLQGMNRFGDLGISTIGQQALMLALVTVTFAAGAPDATDVVLFLCLASGVAALYALVRIGIANVGLGWITRPRFHLIGKLGRWGVQGEIGNLLQLANYRIDQYIIRDIVGLSAVGVYAVGASLTEAVFVLANAVALVLMPRLTAASTEDAAAITPVACRNTMLIAAGGSLALAVMAPFVVPPVFGDIFGDSVEPLWLLLPGTVALTGSKVLTSYIFSQGRPLVNTGITVVSLVVTLVATLALVPLWGINGAALASSLAYGAHFSTALYAYTRISGQSVWSAVVPRPEDVDLYLGVIRQYLSIGARRVEVEPGETRV